MCVGAPLETPTHIRCGIAPVNREMILNYISHQSLGLPKPY